MPRVCKSLPKEARKTRAFIRRWIGDVQCYNALGPNFVDQSFKTPAKLGLSCVHTPLLGLPRESAASSSSTIFRPSIISKVKRTMPLSLPLCSK